MVPSAFAGAPRRNPVAEERGGGDRRGPERAPGVRGPDGPRPQGGIIRSQGLDSPIFDGMFDGSAEQWRMIYQLASPGAFVDAVVEALNEAPRPVDVAE